MINISTRNVAARVMCGFTALLIAANAWTARAQDHPWSGGFNEPGTNGQVYATAVFDNGNGPAVYVGGNFTVAGGGDFNYISSYNGTEWAALGPGLNGPVFALVVFDDGSGPTLYAGGTFTRAGDVPVNHIARWNGTGWSALGGGIEGVASTSVLALTVYDDGRGPALYAGGSFSRAGGGLANNIARWSGTAWSSLGQGADATVRALAVYDGVGGPALIAGGDFMRAGGVSATAIAQWNGSSWSALGGGMGASTSPSVSALTVFDDGTDRALVAGGNFSRAGGVVANAIARWNGRVWSALGNGMASDSGGSAFVAALTVFDDGTGAVLVAGGNFTRAGEVAAHAVAQWGARGWSALGDGMGAIGYAPVVYTMTGFDAGGGPGLMVGGAFDLGGALYVNAIAIWYGNHWLALGQGLNGAVMSLTVFNDGTGDALYAGGFFTLSGGASAHHVAKWDGISWSGLGSGMNSGTVLALTVYDDGGGPALFAAGEFAVAGGVAANRIAKWDGSSWSALGSGTNGQVNALAVFNDGSGSALYAAGDFTMAGGVIASYIAKWNGSTWSRVGQGLGLNFSANALTVYDNGFGTALYVGGLFTTAGGVTVNGIAKWDGSSWSALGGGTNGRVSALPVYNFAGGLGQTLYAGGFFTVAGGVSANNIADWYPPSWSAEGQGLNDEAYALAVDAGGGEYAVYAGGAFTLAGGITANRIAKWDGATWSRLGSGVGGPGSPDVRALAIFDDGSGKALYVGGFFTTAGGKPSAHIARW